MPVEPTLPSAVEKPRRPLRPLHGIPEPERRGRTGPIVSGLFHLTLLLALILPPFFAELLSAEQGGAGGPGPAGGGGGGSRGTGGEIRPERIRFLQMAAPAPAPTKAAVTPTPAPIPPPKPVEPVPEPTVVPPPEPTSIPEATASGTAIPTSGTGGGSGTDGTDGNGPGRGGGIGSGVGTGRGSSEGPGTGGGGQDIFPPQALAVPILPIPVPSRIKPFTLRAYFDVDERGNAQVLSYNRSSDAGYNRKIREMLAEVRFRPATRADGTPVRDTALIVFIAHD